MKLQSFSALMLCLFFAFTSCQKNLENASKPDFSGPKTLPGMKLVWQDEFNDTGKPDPANWRYENGFVRNQELQWYQSANATCQNGVLRIESRRESVPNPNYQEGSRDWRTNRQVAAFTSASIQTRGLHQWQYGRFEIRARIDTTCGSWPAIWTLGLGPWPVAGEIDIMEFYRVNGTPSILANFAWAGERKTQWNDKKIPITHFFAKDKNWHKKFHLWRMEWTEDQLELYLDDELLNSQSCKTSLNPDGSNPFLKPQFLLLNLAIGGNGGEPRPETDQFVYEVDYVRVYQKE